MSNKYNIFYSEKHISGFLIRKLSRRTIYYVVEFNDYFEFISFLNSNVSTSLFEKKYYIFILSDLIKVDKDLFLTHDLDGHIVITNNFFYLTNSNPLNLLAKNLSKNNFTKLVSFLVSNFNNLYIEKLIKMENININQLCSILEYMDITNSELPFESYISAGNDSYFSGIGRIIEIIEDGERDSFIKLSTIHPGAISLYLQKKLISNLKDGANKEININKLISLYENDKYVKLYPNEANFLLKLRFKADKLS